MPYFYSLLLGDLSKIKWQRASRTDKGVHALCNCASCKLNITEEYLFEKFDLNSDSFKARTKKQKLVDFKKIIYALNKDLQDVKVFGKIYFNH